GEEAARGAARTPGLRETRVPEGVPGLLARRAAGLEQLGVHAVDALRRVAPDRPAGGVPATRALPLRVERPHDGLRVDHVAEPAPELRLEVTFALRAAGKLEPELPVERDPSRPLAESAA